MTTDIRLHDSHLLSKGEAVTKGVTAVTARGSAVVDGEPRDIRCQLKIVLSQFYATLC